MIYRVKSNIDEFGQRWLTPIILEDFEDWFECISFAKSEMKKRFIYIEREYKDFDDYLSFQENVCLALYGVVLRCPIQYCTKKLPEETK